MTAADTDLDWPAEPPDDDGQPPAHRPTGGGPPHDDQAERAVLGAMLISAQAINDAAPTLTSSDFYRPNHATIYATITAMWAAGTPVDPLTTAAFLAEQGELNRVGGANYLHTLIAAVPTVANATWYARTVAELAVDRRVIETGVRIQQLGQQRANSTIPERRQQLLEQIRADIDELSAATPSAGGPEAVELDVFLEDADDDREYDWVIPDALERGDRLILTGQEGGGKSTLLRQVAIQVASGIHPFTGSSMARGRVLYVDLENPRRQMRRKLSAIRIAAKDRYQPTPGLHMHSRPQGLDLLNAADERLLTDLVAAVKPDILIIGPIYKLVGGDPKEEGPAKAAATVLDRLRADVGCAILMEAHSPLGVNGGRRPERPYGASLWLRWPEFGLYLSPEGYLRHWRGDRDERQWPVAVKRGGEWPWTSLTKESDVTWARIVEVCQEMGGQQSTRDLAKLTGKSQSAVSRCIREHRQAWDDLAGLTPETTDGNDQSGSEPDLFGDEDAL
jgi:energy-coupling factor transporter ATP-binding protein EcfA2